MAKTHDTVASVVHEDPHHEEPGVLSPDTTMVLLTWVTFFLLLTVLHKFAWKPILAALDSREEAIRKSVESAEHIEAQMARLEETRQEIINKTETTSQQMIAEARQAAEQAAKSVQAKAREEARIIMENAQRDLKEDFDRAQADLKQQSADLAVKLASKLLEENLDAKKNEKIVKQYLKDW